LLASGHLTNYLLLLLKGLAITLQLSLGSLVLGRLGGIVLGAMCNSGWRALKAMAVIYIEAVRSIPFVILLFFVFFAVPLALDIDIPPYPAAIAALSVHCSAYMGEVVRSGIASIPKGQWEATASLGLPYYRIMRHIVLPQALRVMIRRPSASMSVRSRNPRSPRSSGLSNYWVREWRSARRIPHGRCAGCRRLWLFHDLLLIVAGRQLSRAPHDTRVTAGNRASQGGGRTTLRLRATEDSSGRHQTGDGRSRCVAARMMSVFDNSPTIHSTERSPKYEAVVVLVNKSASAVLRDQDADRHAEKPGRRRTAPTTSSHRRRAGAHRGNRSRSPCSLPGAGFAGDSEYAHVLL
jgi:His/Glu/Gln/Arg/opine family amino acid ABC transporter permease subunit